MLGERLASGLHPHLVVLSLLFVFEGRGQRLLMALAVNYPSPVYPERWGYRLAQSGLLILQ